MEKIGIAILLSSYNGEQYLKEQIDSILNQQDVNVHLYVRDDGSSDSTLDLLEKYNKLPNCSVEFGSSIGAKNSFLWLIENAPDYEYYAFSDQDDVWDNDKLIVGVNSIIEHSCVLYHGLAGKVDKYLNEISNEDYVPISTFGAALLSSATGCTMVFTQKLMRELKRYQPENISMHDAWVYRLCFALGFKVMYDPISHMKYRQHENNVSGGQMSFRQKMHKILKNKNLKYNVAEEIKNGYWSELSSENKKTLAMFLDYKLSLCCRIKILFSHRFNQKKLKTNIQNKFIFALGLI